MAEQESVYLFSTTALTNGGADPAINFAEGQLPSSVNNSARALMASVARFLKDNNGSLTTAGSANAYTLTINGKQTAYATGHILKFKASFSNTGAVTLNVTNADATAIGAKAIRGQGDVALVSGQMISGGVYEVRYDTAANSAAGAWILLNPTPSLVAITDATTYLPNYLSGFEMLNSSATTVLVTPGVATDSTNVAFIRLAANLTKSTSTWAVGDTNGGLDTGAIAANTWYHWFVILRTDTGVVDALLSTSATAPTMPTGYTYKRRIGSTRTNGSSQFTFFVNTGDKFIWGVPVADISATNPGTSAVTRTLTAPTGIRNEVILSVFGNNTSGGNTPGGIFISDLSITDTAASSTVFNMYAYAASGASEYVLGASLNCYTNTSAQVRSRIQISDANTIIKIVTHGWIDRRGRDG